MEDNTDKFKKWDMECSVPIHFLPGGLSKLLEWVPTYQIGQHLENALTDHISQRVSVDNGTNISPAVTYTKHHLEHGRTVIMCTDGNGKLKSIGWSDEVKIT